MAQEQLQQISAPCLSLIEQASAWYAAIIAGDDSEVLTRASALFTDLSDEMEKIEEYIVETEDNVSAVIVTLQEQIVTGIKSTKDLIEELAQANPYTLPQEFENHPELIPTLNNIAENIDILIKSDGDDAELVLFTIRAVAADFEALVQKIEGGNADIERFPVIVADARSRLISAQKDAILLEQNGLAVLDADQAERLEEVLKDLQDLAETGDPTEAKPVSEKLTDLAEELTGRE